MKIRINVPERLGAYKLNREARRTTAKNMINKHLRLFQRMNQKVTSIILVIDGKEYIVKPKSEVQKLVDHAENLIS